MITYKVYDNSHKARNWMRYYADFNQASVFKVKEKDMKVELKNGSVIYFKTVDGYNSLDKLQGCEINWLELDTGSVFTQEVEEWLKTRVRIPSNLLTLEVK